MIFDDITAKEWLLFSLGVGVTGIFALLPMVVEILRQYARVVPLLGEWHTYHWSRINGEPVFRHEKWWVRRSISGIGIETDDEHREHLHYRGKVSFASSHVVLTFAGKGHEELLHVRFNAPIPNEDTIMVGIYSAEDFDHELYAGITIACRRQRSDDDAKALLARRYQFDTEEQAIRVRKLA